MGVSRETRRWDKDTTYREMKDDTTRGEHNFLRLSEMHRRVQELFTEI